MADNKGSGSSGLTEAEAKEFHGMFITSFIAFTVVAIVAHFLPGSGARGSLDPMAMRPPTLRRCFTS